MQCGHDLTNDPEFKTLQAKTGIPAERLKYMIRAYQSKTNQSGGEGLGPLPPLYMLPGADSTNYVKDFLQLEDNNITSKASLLEKTASKSIKEAEFKLNKEFTDKNIKIETAGTDGIIVKINNRPQSKELTSDYKRVTEIDTTAFLDDIMPELIRKFGMDVVITTTEDTKDINPLGRHAFINNGRVYICDANFKYDLVHEFMHILVGSLRSNSSIKDSSIKYQELVDSVSKFENYDRILQDFNSDLLKQTVVMTRNDINEEILIQEITKLFNGEDTPLQNLPQDVKDMLNDNIKYVLDTLLDGNQSVFQIEDFNIFDNNTTMLYLANLVQSNNIINKCTGSINPGIAMKNRVVSNIKTAMRSGKVNGFNLTETCI